MSRSKTKRTWEPRNQMFWWHRSFWSLLCTVQENDLHEPLVFPQADQKWMLAGTCTWWCLADRANSEISSKMNLCSISLEMHLNQRRDNQKKELQRSLGNFSSEHRKTRKAVGWTAYFFSASFGIEISAFRHNLNIWGFGLLLPPPHPQSTVRLPSLSLVPWGARDFCRAEACVPGRRALRCRDSVEEACAQAGCPVASLPAWGGHCPLGSLQHEVFSDSYGTHRRCFWFLKTEPRTESSNEAEASGDSLGRAEENVPSCHTRNDPEHNLASAKALCNPVSTSTFLVLRYSIFFCNGHSSLFSHKGRQKGYRGIQNWNNISGFLTMT